MKKIAFHSFKGGTGKTNLAASTAAVIASRGQDVAILDLDLTAPGQHELFRLDPSKEVRTFDDFLWGRCTIADTVLDYSHQAGVKGRLLLVPASMRLEDIQRVLRTGYEVAQFASGLARLEEQYALDCLIMDTHPGVGEDALLALASADEIYLCLVLDRQHYTGTAIINELATMMGKEVHLIINKVPRGHPPSEVVARIEEQFRRSVAACIPLEQEIMAAESGELVGLTRPETRFAEATQALADGIMGRKPV